MLSMVELITPFLCSRDVIELIIRKIPRNRYAPVKNLNIQKTRKKVLCWEN